MTLELIDFVVETDGVDLEDFPPEVQKRINEELDELTGGDGGPGSDPDNPPQSIIVDAGGDGDYESIQTAIDEEAGSGDVIFVEPGDYESFTVDVDDLTLEGPNAGIAGDSDQRGDEATITGKVNIGGDPGGNPTLSGEVVIDGIEMATTTSGLPDGVVSIADRSERVENATIKNSVVDIEPSGVGVGIAVEEVDNLTIENNEFTESGSGTSVAVNVVETAASNIELSGNMLTDVDRLYNEGAGFIEGRGISSTTVRIVDNDVNGAGTAIGIGDSEDSLETVDYVISGNEIEASSVGILQNGGTPASFTIENNDFIGDSGTIYVDDAENEILDLSAILNDQGNTFDPDADVTDEDDDGTDDRIVAE
ncbi:hypothetical protein C470_10987 [Halorubrum distributum JCM 13561]|uniref:Periplasmic copper-binding protein NosD beta helix domain-containing protein n=1 Tax=Halorubrum distributum JCM 13561 TaxID=1227483 RepID=M0NN73_9EURY|nr:right-handed parallel beta-helix repeat-containing protein [Halorubrum litoreum]EMA59397.1 hypothetical protein C470_10987 [Halorubrum litoreum JCM 13561]